MKVIIIILQAILNLVRKRRDLIANRSKIPPEYRDDVVVWYSPKKQKLTEYDVIESYVEDFTNWNYVKARGTVTVSQHKFIITECVLNGLGIVEDVREPYSNLTVRITGITDNQGVLITDYVNGHHQIINTITEDGIYTIEDRHHFIGFGCNFVGTCNIIIEQLPTSILKDFSGNGLDAYMYGFQGKLNSGVGIYQQDFTNMRNATTVSSNGFEVAKKRDTYLARISIGYWNNKECKLLFETNNTTQFYYIRYRKANNDIVATVRLYNGENIIPAQDDLTDVSEVIFEGIVGDNEYIRVTEIPDYPNSLCYAGKQYCKVYDLPDIDDYTVITRRTWFSKTSRNTFISNSTYAGGGAFIFEIFDIQGDTVYTFGNTNKVIFAAAGISYQTKTKYNNRTIAAGTAKSSNTIWIGHLRDNDGIFSGCHDDIIILKRSLTINEINDITEAIFNETIIEE